MLMRLQEAAVFANADNSHEITGEASPALWTAFFKEIQGGPKS